MPIRLFLETTSCQFDGWFLEFTIRLYLVLSLRTSGAMLHFPIRLHVVHKNNFTFEFSLLVFTFTISNYCVFICHLLCEQRSLREKTSSAQHSSELFHVTADVPSLCYGVRGIEIC